MEGYLVAKELYKRYKIVAAKLNKDSPLIPYNKYSTKWQQLKNELEGLNINPDAFFEFTLNYMTNVYANNFFSYDNGDQFKIINRYLKYIESGNEAIKDQSKDLIGQYTSLYLLTSLTYNMLLLRTEEIDTEAYSNSLYDLMLAYSPIIIAYKVTHNELKLDLTEGRDAVYYDFIKQGYFDKFYKTYEQLQDVSDERLLELYKDSYKKLETIGDQIITIDSNIFLMGTIGTGDFIK